MSPDPPPGTSIGCHPRDGVEVEEVDGTLRIVRVEGAETRGQRVAQRLRGTTAGKGTAGMSADEIMALLRGE